MGRPVVFHGTRMVDRNVGGSLIILIDFQTLAWQQLLPGERSVESLLAVRLRGFTPSGRVGLTRVRFCFLRKREILTARLLQKFSSSPPLEQRDH